MTEPHKMEATRLGLLRRQVLAGAALLAGGAGLLGASTSAVAQSEGLASGPNALGGLRTRLASGHDACLLVLGDSTAYSEFGPYYLFGKAIGQSLGCNVILRRWAEWDVWRATGPKDYAEPVTLNAAAGPTLSIYLAALPGGVAGSMFDGSRRPAALDAIPTPDLIVWHEGHNHQSFEQPIPGWVGLGAGTFLGPIGLAASQWPGVPQALVIQNPWRNTPGYDKVRDALKAVGSACPDLQVLDGFTPFVDRQRALVLYRDNIHPSDAATGSQGAQLIADVLMGAFQAPDPGSAAMSVWPRTGGVNLIDNGDFSAWTAAVPTGWRAEGQALLRKDREVSSGGPYSLAITPDVISASALTKALSATELARVRGKRVTLAMLVKAEATQPAPFGVLVAPNNGANVTHAFGGGLMGVRSGWSWLVASDIPVDANATAITIRFYPAWSAPLPRSLTPVHVQQVSLVEGPLPHGFRPG